MKQNVIQQVLSLEKQNDKALRTLWISLFDKKPPPYTTRTYLIPRLAFRLQELAYGLLEEKYLRHLDKLAEQSEKGKKPIISSKGSTLRIGTRLIREWHGETYEVMVVEKGFEYRGQFFKNLSVIARTITCTRWNGPRFFGLRS